MTPHRLVGALAGALGIGTASWWFLLRDGTTDSDDTGDETDGVDVASGSSRLGVRAVAVLTKYRGARGTGPKGSDGYHRSTVIDRINLGVYGDGAKLLGKPWCARAIRFAYETAAQQLGMPKPFAGIKSTLATVSSWNGKPFSAWRISSPKVGAALLLNNLSHATLIAKVIDSRTVVTIEGNHGDKVANVRRTIDPSKDVIIDVESYVESGRHAVGGLDLLGR